MPSCWRNSPSTLGWIGVRGTSSSWTCAELGGAVRSVLDRSDREDVRLYQPRCVNASAFGLRGYVDNTLPSRCYASPWSCVCVGNFLKLLRSQTVASEPGFMRWYYARVEHKWVVGDISHTAYQHVILWFSGIVRWSGPDRHYAYAYARLVSPLRALVLKGGWRVSVSLTLAESSVATPSPCEG